MKFSVGFSNLPFEPDYKQVIYVENKYDERVNAFIEDNYNLLKNHFDYYGLDFVYLPKLFFDEEIERKVKYYAPYLTTRIIQNNHVPSSFLLRYMSRAENIDNIPPSFLFAPQVKDDEWVFKGLSIELDDKDDDEVIRELLHTIDKHYDRQSIRFSINDRFKEAQFSIEHSCEESPMVMDNNESIYIDDLHEISVEEERRITKPDLDVILEEDIEQIIEDLQEAAKALRLRGISLATIHELIDKQETISRLLITDDLRLLLPDYNNLEIKLSAQYKAIYFLFLNHPEGIVLQQLEDYHHELINYYKRTNNGKLTPKMEDSIKRLEEYGNNQIHVILARIREAFYKSFDEHLAKHYVIDGTKGMAYKISLNPDLIVFEDE